MSIRTSRRRRRRSAGTAHLAVADAADDTLTHSLSLTHSLTPLTHSPRRRQGCRARAQHLVNHHPHPLQPPAAAVGRHRTSRRRRRRRRSRMCTSSTTNKRRCTVPSAAAVVAAVAAVGGEVDLIIVAAVVNDEDGGGRRRRRHAPSLHHRSECTEQFTERPGQLPKNVRMYGAPSALRTLFLGSVIVKFSIISILNRSYFVTSYVYLWLHYLSTINIILPHNRFFLPPVKKYS